MIAPRRREDPRALYHSVAVYSNGLVTVEVWEPVSDWELPPREGGRLWGWTSRRLLRGGRPKRVEAAYRLTDLFEHRRRLTEDWAAYLAQGTVEDSEAFPITRTEANQREAVYQIRLPL